MPADHYRTLNVAPDAEAEVVRAAYLALMRKHHPDRAGDDPGVQGRAQEISAAFAVLGDPHRRAAYDRQRRVASPSPAAAPASARGRAAPSARRPSPSRGPTLETRRRRLRRVRWASFALFAAALGLVGAGAAGVWLQIG